MTLSETTHSVKPPGSLLALILSHDDIEGVVGKLSLSVQDSGEHVGDAFRAQLLAMVEFVQLYFFIQLLPEIQGVCVHACSKDVGFVGQSVDFGDFPVKYGVSSGASSVGRENHEVVLGECDNVTSVGFIGRPLFMVFPQVWSHFVFSGAELQFLGMVKGIQRIKHY